MMSLATRPPWPLRGCKKVSGGEKSPHNGGFFFAACSDFVSQNVSIALQRKGFFSEGCRERAGQMD